jgi:hypothetical protein
MGGWSYSRRIANGSSQGLLALSWGAVARVPLPLRGCEPAGSRFQLVSHRIARPLAGAVAVVLVGLLAAGCGEARHTARMQLFGLQDVYYPRGHFEGSALVRVNPTTLQPLGHQLRLGDAVTSRSLSPDGRTLALGGYSGELLLVDLSKPRRARRMLLVRGHREAGVEVDVVAWPRRARLIAVATVLGAWSQPHPSQLLVVDPYSDRVVRRESLRGSLLASVAVRNGTSALLVTRGRLPRLVVVGADGSSWSERLDRLDLAGSDGVRLGGDVYRPTRVPALASDGRDRVFVVASERPIAEVRLRSRELRYHRVPLARVYLSNPPATTPGSAGPELRLATGATWLGRGQLAVGGFDELPSWVHGFGAGIRERQRALEIVDTGSWRRRRPIRASGCERLGEVILCSAVVRGLPPDGKGVRGPSLVAYDARWRRLYEKRSSQLWWGVTAGRLFAGAADGSRLFELDPRTGRVLRKIRPAPLADQMWPLDLIRWTPRGDA